MFRISTLLIAGLAAIAAPKLQAECIYPDEIIIPDGAASTYEEMRDSQTFVKEYMAEMEAYINCLEQEYHSQVYETIDENKLPDVNNPINEDEQLHTQQRHSAIDAMESVAAKFNEQVRTFKKVNP
ncbi:MAG: hypothetical protein CL797_04085 [Chromatiales bacterium]|jgi:hypothetical protein|nr:hypothetical protein [Chromatiales bacterium]